MAAHAPSSSMAAPVSPVEQAPDPTDLGRKRKLEEAGAGIELTGEDVRKMVEPLHRQQLLDVLQEAAFRHLDVLEDVRRFVDQDPMHRKIFVRGLGWETGADTLKSVFSRFGEVEEGVVIMDKATGKSRGFGFVTFRHMDAALHALKEPSKRIHGRMTLSLLATTGAPSSQPSQDLAARKIYVGNIPFELHADVLLSFFSQYGEVEEGPLGFDKQTGRSRGFAFFVYKTPEAAKHALEEPAKIIDRHQVFCKLAVDGQKQQPGTMHGQQHCMAAPEPSVLQSGANPMSTPNMQYSSTSQSMPNPGMAYGYSMNPTQNSNSALNPQYNPSIEKNQSIGATSSSTTNASSSNLPYSQDISSAANQTTRLPYGVLTYGQLGSYGSQGPVYGGQTSAYSGEGAYGATQGPVASQTMTIQSAGQFGQAAPHPTAASAGHYGQMGSYAVSHQTAAQYGQAVSQSLPTATQYGQVASQSTHTATQYGQVASQTTPTQNVSQYVQMPLQTKPIQTTGQYAQAPYQNQTLAASAGLRAPTAGISTSIPPYYGT